MRIVSTGNTISSPEFYRKKRKARHRRLIFFSLVSLFLLVLLIFLSRMEYFLIKEVEVEGTKAVSAELAEAAAREALAGRYFWLIPRANALLYSRRGLEEMMLGEFPRFKSVGAALDSTKLLKVNVVEREPFALYCPSIEHLEYASECYFLDDAGYIFDKAPSFFGNVYFVYAGQAPLAEPLGQSFMPSAEFQPLSQFIESLSALGMHPLALESGEQEFRLILPRDARLLWRRGADLSLIYSNLEAFLSDEAIKSEPHFWDRVKTLDLRVENKVFYTFKN